MTPVATSPGGAAEALGVARSTIYKWMSEGRIETQRVGGRRLVKIESIRKLLGEAA